MKATAGATRVEDVILRVLQETSTAGTRPIYRTSLVKLVYLVDYIYAQHEGRTLTGLEYFWDNYGPNAVDNDIVKRADRLKWPKGPVEIEKKPTPSGNPSYLYRLRAGAVTRRLGQLGELVIKDVVRKHGNKNWGEIVKASKETRPVLQGKQGERLDLKPDESTRKRLGDIRAIVRDRVYERGQPSVSLGELKARYGIAG